MEIPEGQDVECFLDSCKRHFSAGSRERSEAQLKAQREVRLRSMSNHRWLSGCCRRADGCRLPPVCFAATAQAAG